MTFYLEPVPRAPFCLGMRFRYDLFCVCLLIVILGYRFNISVASAGMFANKLEWWLSGQSSALNLRMTEVHLLNPHGKADK